MVLLLYGENTFLIKEKIDGIKQKFSLKDSSNVNLLEFDGASLQKEAYAQNVFGVPFLAEKKLIILKNFLIENSDNSLSEYIKDSINRIPASSIVIFMELGVPDGRKKLFKTLNKPGSSQNFKFISGSALNSWIVNKVKLEGGQISPSATQKLNEYIGNDLWRAEQEIKKLISYSRSQNRAEIEPKDVEKMVSSIVSPDIFAFIDCVANKNQSRATLMLQDLIDGGENELKVISMIIYQYRNMLSMISLKEKGLGEREIAKATKLHPFVIKKTLSLLSRHREDDLTLAYLMLYDSDRNIKNGIISPQLAINSLVAKLTS